MKAIREYLRRLGKELDQERMPSDRQLSLFVMGMAGTYLFGRGAEQASYVVFGNYIFSDSVLLIAVFLGLGAMYRVLRIKPSPQERN